MSLDLFGVTISLRHGAALFPPLTLSVAPGEVATVMGPSGIGKSTLLDALGGHLPRRFEMAGQVLLDGRDVTALPAEARRIGMLFQDAVLFPHLSVGDNLAFGLSQTVRGRAARLARVEAALDQAGLAGMAGRDPATLSGGQRARAALMRTLLSDPLALLLDEPFSKLDAGLKEDVRRFTFAHIRDRGIPALMVTHDPEDAQAAAGPVIQMAGP
ncbi:MAG: ATP-binding cassette domain-containing protein [Proteobacteria bacterium]|nr:ATP-binding cassette domain-containing protein [Pseudomonadota bacterium]